MEQRTEFRLAHRESVGPEPTAPALLHFQYEPVLDGIRGIAVLVVMGFNLGWTWLSGGFFGVDMFFALSGFLITALLTKEWLNTGSISLRAFFVRRAFRLVPALVLVVCAIVLFSVLFQEPSKAIANGVLGASALLWCSNWLGVWNEWYASLPLGHTWSLGVEVQFYIIWALVCYCVLRRSRRGLPLLAVIALTGAILVFCWRMILWHRAAPWMEIYLRTDTRLDAILIGAFVAILCQLPRANLLGAIRCRPSLRAVIHVLALVAALVLIWTFSQVAIDGPFPYYGGFALAGLATATLILSSLAMPQSYLARFLALRPLVWFGKLSYSLYLWHVPVAGLLTARRLAGLGLPPFAIELLRFVVCVGLAALSFYLVERRFASLRARFRRAGDTPVEYSKDLNIRPCSV